MPDNLERKDNNIVEEARKLDLSDLIGMIDDLDRRLSEANEEIAELRKELAAKEA